MTRQAAMLLLAGILTVPMYGQTTTLHALRDHNRVLLVFAVDNDARVEQQWADMVLHRQDVAERDLVTVLLTSPPVKQHYDTQLPMAMLSKDEQQRLRARFHVGPKTFTVVLIGKDGGEKMRAEHPIAWQRLQETIDAMPMRQTEMKRLK